MKLPCDLYGFNQDPKADLKKIKQNVVEVTSAIESFGRMEYTFLDIIYRSTLTWIGLTYLGSIYESRWSFPSFTKNDDHLSESGRIDTAIWMHYMDSNKTTGEEARRQLHKNAASNLKQVLATTPHKAPTVRPPASYHDNYSS